MLGQKRDLRKEESLNLPILSPGDCEERGQDNHEIDTHALTSSLQAEILEGRSVRSVTLFILVNGL